MVKDVLIGRRLKGITDSADFSLEVWPHPELGTLAQTDRERLLRRKEAVTLYLQGNAQAEIYAATGVQARFLNRLIHERCMHVHPDGRIYSWKGLVPKVHVAKYSDTSRFTLRQKVTARPEPRQPCFKPSRSLRGYLTSKFSKPVRISSGARSGVRGMPCGHGFSRNCALGYKTRHEWPFLVKSMEYMSLCRYADAILSANPQKAARMVDGPQLEKKMVSGDALSARYTTRLIASRWTPTNWMAALSS